MGAYDDWYHSYLDVTSWPAWTGHWILSDRGNIAAPSSSSSRRQYPSIRHPLPVYVRTGREMVLVGR